MLWVSLCETMEPVSDNTENLICGLSFRSNQVWDSCDELSKLFCFYLLQRFPDSGLRVVSWTCGLLEVHTALL